MLLEERKQKSRKARITILIILITIIAGVWIYSQRDTSFTPTTALSSVEPSPTLHPSPNRTLKSDEHFVAPVGLYIQVPENMNFKQETADDIQRTSFNIERNDPPFQFYGLYEGGKAMSEQGLEQTKKEMDPESIKEVTISGFKGVEGLITGPKSRYLIIIIKDDKPITISTTPPTIENKESTDQILSTISFQ